jgi:hypothetical protein
VEVLDGVNADPKLLDISGPGPKSMSPGHESRRTNDLHCLLTAAVQPQQPTASTRVQPVGDAQQSRTQPLESHSQSPAGEVKCTEELSKSVMRESVSFKLPA